jgi:sugar phosphate permease
VSALPAPETAASLEIDSTQARRFRLWQFITVSLLITGYAGYYLCRSDLSVAMPLLIEELSRHGMSPDMAKVRLGGVAAISLLVYAFGKFPAGWIADFFGGRRNFLGGMLGSVLFTALFAMGGGIPLFTLAWIGNRLAQSLGWAGIVKVTSRWFSYSTYGTAMGFISLSYLFGDAASREFLGLLLAGGFGWRTLFFAAAGVLAAILLASTLLLKETPKQLGLPEPPANPASLFSSAPDENRPESFRSLLTRFGRSQAFWMVCLLSFGITLVREAFNLWTPTYFSDAVGLSHAAAAQWSALFPLFGGISVLLAGFCGDRFGPTGRARILAGGLFLSAGLLVALAYAGSTGSKASPVILVAAIALSLLGPYSYLAGAISLDLGGKQASATASGFIDGFGYFGGVLAGNALASVSVIWGWRGAFLCLSAITLLSSIAAFVYLLQQERISRLCLIPPS